MHTTHRANVPAVTTVPNPWTAPVPRHRANVTPRPTTVAAERAAHRDARRQSRDLVQLTTPSTAVGAA